MCKSKRRKENDIIIEIVGNNAEEVTGSSTVVSYMTENGRKLFLVELGQIQMGDMVDEYIVNRNMLDNIPIKEAGYCFDTHLHQDHIGLYPALSSRGFKGRIITTYTNSVLMKPMLKDTVKIHKKNCDYIRSHKYKFKNKIKGKIPYLFNEIDLDNIMSMVDVYELDKIYKLDDYLSFRYTNNSHIIGSTQLEIFIKKYKTNITKKIVFSGDLGNSDNYSYTYFTEPTIPVSKANMLFIESTYGLGDRNFNKRICTEERKELEKDILSFINYGHSCMIPCFALARLSNLMCWLYDTFKDRWDMNKKIIIATKLGKQLNDKMFEVLKDDDLEYWDEVTHWEAFHYITDYKSCETFVTSKDKNYLVLASSGMISGGFSNVFAKEMLQYKHNGILFCGYCSPNTVGGQILDDNVNIVEIEGEKLVKRCIIKKYKSFSSHAGQKDLINYMKQCDCQKIILQHGSNEAKEELKNIAIEEIQKLNRTTKIICSKKGEQYVL